MAERRKNLEGDLSIAETTSSAVNIPIGGGSTTTTVTASNLGLSKIQAILNVHVERQSPETDDVYEPQYGLNSGENAIGLTLYAASGTTLTATTSVLGY